MRSENKEWGEEAWELLEDAEPPTANTEAQRERVCGRGCTAGGACASGSVGRRAGLGASWGILGMRGSLSQLPPKRWDVEGISEEG